MAYAGRFVAENEGGSGICKVLIRQNMAEVIGVHMLEILPAKWFTELIMAIEREMTLTEMQKVVFSSPNSKRK